jgi:hypothetical protein
MILEKTYYFYIILISHDIVLSIFNVDIGPFSGGPCPARKNTLLYWRDNWTADCWISDARLKCTYAATNFTICESVYLTTTYELYLYANSK